jgi:hypothetical protein
MKVKSASKSPQTNQPSLIVKCGVKAGPPIRVIPTND